MITKLSAIIGAFVLFMFAVIGCTSYHPYPDLRPGYTQYLSCLKQCDSLQNVYNIEYRNCNKGCPAPPLNLNALNGCLRRAPTNVQACLNELEAPTTVCEQCSSDYIKHMQEIDSCKQACLQTFESAYRTIATN